MNKLEAPVNNTKNSDFKLVESQTIDLGSYEPQSHLKTSYWGLYYYPFHLPEGYLDNLRGVAIPSSRELHDYIKDYRDFFGPKYSLTAVKNDRYSIFMKRYTPKLRAKDREGFRKNLNKFLSKDRPVAFLYESKNFNRPLLRYGKVKEIDDTGFLALTENGYRFFRYEGLKSFKYSFIKREDFRTKLEITLDNESGSMIATFDYYELT